MSYPNPNCCSNERRCCRVSEAVIGFFGLLLALAMGLMFGTIYYETFMPILASVAAFAAAIAAILAALLFVRSRRG